MIKNYMIYVYVNDTYVGVLSDFISSNSLLCEGSYIFIGESRSDKFTFELHNQAENYVSVGASFKVSCFLYHQQCFLFPSKFPHKGCSLLQ